MSFADFLRLSQKFTVTVGRSKEGWMLITLTAEGVETGRYTVHGSVVTPAEETAPPK